MILTTSNFVEGRPVDQYLGVVTSETVLGVHIFKDLAAAFRNVVGGRSKAYENEIREGVAAVLAELGSRAASLDADAVIAVDLDYETVAETMLLICGSGTAVKLS